MASQVFTDPIILDSTGQQIAAAIEALSPSNVAVDISTSLQASGWTNSSPFTQTWLNNKVSDECGIKVEFLAGAVNDDVLYLEYEKVPGGVKFTAPKKPSHDIPVIVHIINAEAASITNISGDMVSTDVVSGAGNVDEALGIHNEAIETLSTQIATLKEIKVKKIDAQTLSGNGNCSYTFSKNVIVLSVYCFSSDVMAVAFPTGGTGESGGKTWWIHARNTNSSGSVASGSLAFTLVYIEME